MRNQSMEIAALKFAAAVVSPIIKKLGDIASPYFGGDITEEELQKLQSVILPKIRAVIRASADDSIAADELRPWVMHLRAAVYEADDVLDMYEYRRLKAQVSSLPIFIKKMKYGAKKLVAPISLKSKMKKSLERLQSCADEADKWTHLVSYANRRETTMNQQPLPATVSSPSSLVFGRDRERDLLTSKLISIADNYEAQSTCSSRNWRIPLLAIYGLGGAGKTTLAQHIFKNPRIVEYFPKRLWVHLSRELNLLVTTRNIIEQATGDACLHKQTLEALQAHLKEYLGRSKEKLLLVLDDLWLDESKDREPFDQLLIPFNESEHRRSIVFITTRIEQTTSIIGVDAENSLPLEELSSEDCWSIVKHYAFGDAEKVITNSELAQVGNQIIDKLKKSPLAAQMIGVQLGRKVDVNEWKNILRGDILINTMKTLLWSYNRLPAHLQQCFAFCSLFPKGWEFSVDTLVEYWIANGFVEVPNGSDLTLEDQGKQYFNDLLLFSFFKSSNFGFGYVIHDLLHDLAEKVSKGHCCRIEGDVLKDIPETTISHLSIHNTKSLATHMPTVTKQVNLRTFIVTAGSILEEQNAIFAIFEKLTKLRVLNFVGVSLKELDDSIGKLKYLRLLFLRGGDVKKLTESLGRLYHLKYLKVGCSSEHVPKSLNNLVNLGRADEIVFKIQELGKLTKLQTLPWYEASKKRGHEIGQLKNLNELRGSLTISCLENVRGGEEAAEARLKDKMHLDRFDLQWTGDSCEGNGRTDAEVLEGLQPHPNIKELHISKWKGEVSPKWMLEDGSCLVNLQDLVLYNCSKWKDLPPLGHLPCLSSLEITYARAVEEVGCGFYGTGCSTAFPNLKLLKFEGMYNWIRWSVPLGVEGVKLFPCLSELRIWDCPKLTGIPSLPPSLCDLEILRCSGLMQVPSLPPSLCGLSISGCPNLMMELSPFPPLLKHLTLENCPGTKTLISETMSSSSSSSLQSLNMSNCYAPDVMLLTCPSSLTSVTSIRIEYCESLISLDMSIKSAPDVMTCPSSLTSVTCISIWKCESLTSLVLGDNMKALLSLTIYGCKNLRSVEGIGSLPSLKELEIWNCPMLVMSMEPVVYHVTCERVSIKGCPNLSFGRRSAGGEVVHRPSCIKSLEIDDPSLFEEMSEDLTSLSDLIIQNFVNTQSLPLNNLSSLKELELWRCPELESLPEMENLSSLEVLRIYDCPKLESLPELENLSSLKVLTIES